jgi:uncharacterized protein (TIGR00369 family)
MTGLELLQGIRTGAIPPPGFAVLLDLELDHVEEGRVTFALVPGEAHLNPLGTVHGGLLATMLDSAMGCAVQSVLPAESTYTTLQLDVKYVRAPPVGQGRIVAEGTVVHAGRRTATAEGRVLDAGGRLCAHATTTCLVLPAADVSGRETP